MRASTEPNTGFGSHMEADPDGLSSQGSVQHLPPVYARRPPPTPAFPLLICHSLSLQPLYSCRELSQLSKMGASYVPNRVDLLVPPPSRNGRVAIRCGNTRGHCRQQRLWRSPRESAVDQEVQAPQTKGFLIDF